MQQNEELFKQALSEIKLNDFSKAKSIFQKLLSLEPTNIEFEAGFFNLGWWIIRRDNLELKKGRIRASWLMKNWNEFTTISNSRSYTATKCYEELMYCIINEAVENYKIAFYSDENLRNTDPNLLIELALCLLKLKDYTNAIEILNYARSKSTNDISLSFLLAEVLCFTDTKDNIQKGLTIYRETFINDFQNYFETENLNSNFSLNVLNTVKEFCEDDFTKLNYWFPSFLMISAMPYNLKPLKDKEISKVLDESKRLILEKERVSVKFRDKVHAILGFYIMTLILQFLNQERDPFILQEYEKELYSISPKFYNYYVNQRDSL